jgi:hypothetical protein
MTKEQMIPAYITHLRPTMSAILPENGRESPAETENNKMINPFCFSPPRLVMKLFNSGMIKLKPVMKKNIAKHTIQKLRLYLDFMVQKYT